MQKRIKSFRAAYETGQLTLTQIAAQVPCSSGYLSYLKSKWKWEKPPHPIDAFKGDWMRGHLTFKDIGGLCGITTSSVSQLARHRHWSKSPEVAPPPPPPPRAVTELDLRMGRYRDKFGKISVYDISDRSGLDLEVVKQYILDNGWETPLPKPHGVHYADRDQAPR